VKAAVACNGWYIPILLVVLLITIVLLTVIIVLGVLDATVLIDGPWW
jgi:hypothetical protein